MYDDLTQRVLDFVAREAPVVREQVTPSLDIIGETGIWGVDVDDLVEDFGKEFGGDVSNYRWYHHTGPEGWYPLWLFYKPWWARKTRVAITVQALVDSARAGVWILRYPEHEREP